jgi:hypothetical protein
MAKRPKKDASVEPANIVGGTTQLNVDDLSERQQRGLALWQASQMSNGLSVLLSDEETVWFSQTDPTRSYRVGRDMRNRRGAMVAEYRCACEDFIKNGTPIDCKHIVAEKLRRGVLSVAGAIQKPRKVEKLAERRPARTRLAFDGKSIRTSQRRARRKMPDRVPELVLSLGRAYNANQEDVLIPIRPQIYRGGRKGAPMVARAIALVSKVARGLSADEMMPEYQRMINDGTLPLSKPPDPDTLGNWVNDERLTPILQEFLRQTSLPFRNREIGGIIDSSKVSQMMTAHSRTVEYGSDERYGADWAKCHALVGVETMVVMGVAFSGTRGVGNAHDINFLMPLVLNALKTFSLKYLLGDKAYLSGPALEALWEKGIKAVIPIKKGWYKDKTGSYHEAITNLVRWFDADNNRLFHEVYRLRPKVEALFSLLKRMSGGYCWSRGRSRKEANADVISTAWQNELLCKFIYLNLRTTVTLEEETGYEIDYMISEKRFPKPSAPLLVSAA